MADRLWLVAPGTLHETEIGKLEHRELPNIDAVGEDEPIRIFGTNRGDKRSSNLSVALFEIALVRTHLWGLVDQIKRELLARHTFIAAPPKCAGVNTGLMKEGAPPFFSTHGD